MANIHLKNTVLQVVDNQINTNEPPVTKATYERLRTSGYNNKQAKEKISAVLLEEMYDILKQKEAFNEERFAKKLENLK